MKVLLKRLADRFPELGLKLKQAGYSDTPETFIKKTIMSTAYTSVGLLIFFMAFLARMKVSKMFFVIVFLISAFMLFGFFFRAPDVYISKKDKDISKEIVFAGRFLIIELESGVSLYNAFSNLGRSYPVVGRYFREIVDKIDMGTPMEDAINEALEYNPSRHLRRVLWQILNVMKTGAEVSRSINSVIEQIVREQMIEVKAYGKRLSPLAMFYMIIAVILPSLGITMLLVLSSFLSLNLDLIMLLSITGLLAFMQFMFLAMIKSSRPAVEF